MKNTLAIITVLAMHALAGQPLELPGTPDTLRIAVYNESKGIQCLDEAGMGQLRQWAKKQENELGDRDRLIADLYKRDSIAQATIEHWKLYAEALETKDANWQQGWNTLLSEHKTCTQALRMTLEAATNVPPPSPMLPKIQAAAGGLLAGFAIGWLLFGL